MGKIEDKIVELKARHKLELKDALDTTTLRSGAIKDFHWNRENNFHAVSRGKRFAIAIKREAIKDLGKDHPNRKKHEDGIGKLWEEDSQVERSLALVEHNHKKACNAMEDAEKPKLEKQGQTGNQIRLLASVLYARSVLKPQYHSVHEEHAKKRMTSELLEMLK